ncbi:MAG: hypothetical protein L0H63_16450, partial [Nitrococcus sp.]|nr:hypothetical protein [Nitrococcus sp.]
YKHMYCNERLASARANIVDCAPSTTALIRWLSATRKMLGFVPHRKQTDSLSRHSGVGRNPVDSCMPTQASHHCSAGTAKADDEVITTEGQCVCAPGDTLADVQLHAYARVDRMCWHGTQCRRDIGHPALPRCD